MAPEMLKVPSTKSGLGYLCANNHGAQRNIMKTWLTAVESMCMCIEQEDVEMN